MMVISKSSHSALWLLDCVLCQAATVEISATCGASQYTLSFYINSINSCSENSQSIGVFNRVTTMDCV